MNIPASLPNKSVTKPTFACVRCSERKVRCSRQSPCNACVRHNVQCIFRSPKPSRKKRNLAEVEWVKERLKHCEALLRESGVDPDEITTTGQSPMSAPIGSEAQATTFKPQLLHGPGGTKFVDK